MQNEAQDTDPSGQWLRSEHKVLNLAKTVDISNPLVVTLGIGKYNGLPQLIVTQDYKNIIYSFNCKRGYTVAYCKQDNNLKVIKNRIVNQSDVKDTFKIEWNCNQITSFNNGIKQNVLVNNNKSDAYDALIYFVSCHGAAENVIYDSNCDEYEISRIINTFNNKNCKYLRQKPKLFIFDCCRGRMRTTRIRDAAENNNALATQTHCINVNINDSKATTKSKQETDEKKEQMANVFDEKINKKNDAVTNSNALTTHTAAMEPKQQISKKLNNAATNSNALTNQKHCVNIKLDSKAQMESKQQRDEKKDEIENALDWKSNKTNNGNETNVTNNNNINNFILSKFYHEASDMRIIFANLDGYKAWDAGKKGGYLIWSLTKVISNDRYFKRHDLDGILMQTRKVCDSKIGTVAAHVMDDYNKFQNYFVKFREKSVKLASNSSSNTSAAFSSNFNFNESIHRVSGYKTLPIRNPLVVMVGIGDYKETNGMWNDIKGVFSNYCNVKYCFNYIRGYTILYQTKNNNIKLLRQRVASKSKIRDEFKIHWTCDELENLNKYIIENVLNLSGSEAYDALLYVISAHANSDDKIIDSKGDDCNLSCILDTFSNQKCGYLRNKPKIFIMDTSRGNKNNSLLANSAIKTGSDASVESKNNSSSKPNSNDNDNDMNVNSVRIDNKVCNKSHYIKDDNIRIIYATAQGYSKLETINEPKKGSLFIRCLDIVVRNDEIFNKLNLTQIAVHWKQAMIDRIGNDENKTQNLSANVKQKRHLPIVEDNNRMPYCVQFQTK